MIVQDTRVAEEETQLRGQQRCVCLFPTVCVAEDAAALAPVEQRTNRCNSTLSCRVKPCRSCCSLSIKEDWVNSSLIRGCWFGIGAVVGVKQHQEEWVDYWPQVANVRLDL